MRLVTVSCQGCGYAFEVKAEVCYDGTNGEQWIEHETNEDGEIPCQKCGDDVLTDQLEEVC